MKMKINNKYKKQGFTLLEVLVALAILAIALSAAIKVSTANVENASYLRDRTLAHWVAMNILTEIQIKEVWPSLGKKTGTTMMAEREWFWIMNTSNTIDKELRRVEIKVYYKQEDENALSLLVGFIPLP